jgi:transcriptional regulator with XRE-family HTH domain
MVLESGRVEPRTLGEHIRWYRLRLRQIHTGTPWAQEDLAVAIGSDKSHINRIECGHSLPTRSTVARICDALALSWQERATLLALGGYILEPLEPTEDEVERVRQYAAHLVSGGAYSVCLKDRGLRIWDLNDIFAYAFMGFPDRASCLAHVKGMRTVDELLDPRLSEWYQRTIVDFESYVRRQLTRFLNVYRPRLNEPPLQATEQAIRAHPIYGRIWAGIELQSSDTPWPAFLDHQLVTVDHPHLGRYSAWIWHSSLTIDQRFFVSHHVPANAESHALIEHLSVRFSRRRTSRRRLASSGASQASSD